MSLERDPRVPEQTQVRQGQPWSSAGHTDPPCPAASLGCCSPGAPMLRVMRPAGAQPGLVSPSVFQCSQLTVPHPCTVPSTAFLVPRNQRNSGLHGQSCLHAPEVMTEDQGSSPLATVLLVQFALFAITGAGHLLPLAHTSTKLCLTQMPLLALLLPLVPLCPPSPQMHITHGTTYGSKKPTSVVFGDTKICSACWKSGDW